MPSPFPRQRCLTELDHIRLLKITGAHPPVAMADLLDQADIVPSQEVAPDVVTMYSQVQVSEDDTGAHRTLTLCYPQDAEPQRGFISVLSPVGTALLGQRVGATALVRSPAGTARAMTVEAVLFQPEASGDYTT